MKETNMNVQTKMKIAVIGAGAAGLTATKRLVEPGRDFECVTFERSNSVGGTWVYTDHVGKDQYGLPVHSSMYQGLRTNLPKQIMSLPDYPHTGKSEASYVSSQDVLNYFEEYADHFELRKYIKFLHHVNEIAPTANGKWKIKVTELKRQKDFVYYFDNVIVCIGNYSNPIYPQPKGIENFKGTQLHSHDYKEPSRFKGMNVLVVGAGSSGLDITNQISDWADKVYLSHHSEKARNVDFSENVTQKPDIKEVASNGNVIFTDGSELQLDAIIYCTGYEYKYPFLSPECKITVENMVVKPLYKHFINIEHPTMCIIGIPRDCPGFTLFDLQVTCFLNIIRGKVTLPSKTEMYAEMEADIKKKTETCGKSKYYHIMNKQAQSYFDSLSALGNLPITRKIIFDIYFYSMEKMIKDFRNFRKSIYRVIDDEQFAVFE